MKEGERYYDGALAPASAGIELGDCPSSDVAYTPYTGPDQRPTVVYATTSGQTLEVRNYKATVVGNGITFQQTVLVSRPGNGRRLRKREPGGCRLLREHVAQRRDGVGPLAVATGLAGAQLGEIVGTGAPRRPPSNGPNRPCSAAAAATSLPGVWEGGRGISGVTFGHEASRDCITGRPNRPRQPLVGPGSRLERKS